MSGLFVETRSEGLKLKWRKAAWEGLRPLGVAAVGLPLLLPEGWAAWGWLGLLLWACREAVHIFYQATLWVTPDGLSVQSSLFPWSKKQVLLRKEISSLSCTPSVRGGFFQLEVVRPDEKRTLLIRRLPSPHVAESVAQLIHQNLSRVVAGS